MHKVSWIWLNNAWLKHWSLPINFVAWYVLTVVHPDITTVSIRDWQRVYKGSMIKPKINMWCMNFIERQGMVSFKVFLVKCMMHEVLFKIHRMPDFFFKKKVVGKTRVVSYSPVFSFGKCFPGFPFNWSRTKEIKCRSCFFLFRFDWTEARITLHVLNILATQQCCVKFTLDDYVTLSLLCCCWFVFHFSPLTPKTQYPYSPYCSLYIS